MVRLEKVVVRHRWIIKSQFGPKRVQQQEKLIGPKRVQQQEQLIFSGKGSQIDSKIDDTKLGVAIGNPDCSRKRKSKP